MLTDLRDSCHSQAIRKSMPSKFNSLKLTSKRCFSKNSFGYPLFFTRVLKLCMFLLNVECDEFDLRRRSVSPFPSFSNYVLSLRLVDDTNKNSCIERSLFVCNAFAHRGGVSVESLAFVHFCVQECNF